MEQNYRRKEMLTEPKTIDKEDATANESYFSPPLTMEVFLMDIEKKAYHMAAFATNSHADALDLLQDSMIKLVSNYQQRPANEWKPLFYKILQNRIRDWHRHQKIRNMVYFWKNTQSNEDNNDCYPMATHESNINTPEDNMSKHQQQTAALEHLVFIISMSVSPIVLHLFLPSSC